jgi:hypothetical protein
MAGLNYGNSFRRTKRRDKSEQSVEGVSYGEIIKKWIVRIKINNRLSSIGAYDTKEEADNVFSVRKNGT